MNVTGAVAAAARVSVPRRHIVVALTFLSVVVAYTDRVGISVAAVAMRDEYGWSQTEKGLVLSSFFLGYLLFMLASGWLATRFGGKRVLLLSGIAWSLFTLATPAAAAASLTMLVIARIGMGMGESAVYPATCQNYARWIPRGEVARAFAGLYGGIPIGTVVGLSFTGWIIGRFNWPASFYVFGVAGLLWCVLWSRMIPDDPHDDARVQSAERAVLPPRASAVPPGTPSPWRRVLGSAPVWAMVTAHFATNWTMYVLLSWLPSYFREVQGLSIANAGLFSAAPWLAMFAVTVISAPVADGLIRRGMSVTRARKWMQCGSLLGTAAFLLALQAAHSAGGALLLLCGATGLLGAAASGYAPNAVDLSSRHSALIGGFSNTFGTAPGVVGVAATGWMVDVTGTYRTTFILSAAIAIVGAAVYAALFKAEGSGL